MTSRLSLSDKAFAFQEMEFKMKMVLYFVLFFYACTGAEQNITPQAYIQPYSQNAHYWQYKGTATLLAGGSKDDNLFQLPDLKTHLDSLFAIGGNYIRNTMSSRVDKGWEVYRFKKLPDGTYDLDQWNPEYWHRFETLLRLCYERDIIVQIELWDRFDYSRDHWRTCPWNPGNNINYTYAETGFAAEYPKHPSRDVQPFFHSIPGMTNYSPKYDIFRVYQEKFVTKLLSISLDFPNVLYCINNETSTSPKWGQYWIQFIREKAAARGLPVYITDMFDDFWRGEKSENINQVFGHPGLYQFVDISQVNSRNFDQDHWDRLLWLHEQASDFARPLNNTKIYGGNESSFGSGTNDDGVERFWRHIIGGSASVRHHRPPTGCGLNAKAQACIKAVRKMETLVKMWDVQPRMELLSQRESDEAYLAAAPGKSYLLYFTDGGDVALDLSGSSGALSLHWINISNGEWGAKSEIQGGTIERISAPASGGWLAVITKP